MTDEKPQQPQPAADAVPFVYANVFFVTVGAYDVVMDFGFKSPEDAEAYEQDPEGGPRFAPGVRIAMSHAHAKSMLPILARLIGQFEASQGSIPSPGFGTFEKE